MSYVTARNRGANSDINKLYPEDRAIHEWYRFILSFPPHLVRSYLERFDLDSNHTVLDPFCGTGTVLVECKKFGICSVGIEANPVAHFASTVKVDWQIDTNGLLEHARRVGEMATTILRSEGIEDEPFFHIVRSMPEHLRTLPPESLELLLSNSISPLPLHKTLVLLDCLKQHQDERYQQHEMLALAKALVSSISNLAFGPEVGIGTIKTDAPVISTWLGNVQAIVHDISALHRKKDISAQVHLSDARLALSMLQPCSIDAVITSPPYPNEKDYTRTTRLESVLLGFIHNKADLQALKRGLLRSNTRNVYKGDSDDYWVATQLKVQDIARTIEARRIELGKTSGFERLYERVTKLYFGGIARHLASLRPALRPGAKLAYVVGDQASYLQVMIPTGHILADIAQSLGYELVGIDLFRTRLATATKEQLREEVVILQWPEKIRSSFHQQYPHSTPPTSQVLTTNEYEGSNSITEDSTTQKMNRYQQIMERIFFWHYQDDTKEILFDREDMIRAAQELNIKLPKNIGDIIYTFRYRGTLPSTVKAKSPEGEEWIIRPAGRGHYRFVSTPFSTIIPNKLMHETKVPDATPAIITMYAQSDEQALLARLRYNRLIDIFTGITCYSLQNHMRTTVQHIGQVETDEVYIGIDKRGAHYVLPVQVKGAKDKLGIVQIEQDIALCAEKFPSLTCRPIAAQFMEDDLIALFELEESENGVVLTTEKHYRLVSGHDITQDDIRIYHSRPTD